MNLSNKITLYRMILGPFFLFTYLKEWIYLSLFILFLNLFSDLLDGYLARSRKEITEFGEFMDPSVDLLFFLFVALSLSIKGITQINWFFIPLLLIGFSFIFKNFKHKETKIIHTKIKYVHTACIYLLVLIVLFDTDFENFFWITFAVFTITSLELFIRGLKSFLKRRALIA